MPIAPLGEGAQQSSWVYRSGNYQHQVFWRFDVTVLSTNPSNFVYYVKRLGCSLENINFCMKTLFQRHTGGWRPLVLFSLSSGIQVHVLGGLGGGGGDLNPRSCPPKFIMRKMMKISIVYEKGLYMNAIITLVAKKRGGKGESCEWDTMLD